MTALKNRSYTSISNTGYSTINITAAFEFDKFEENNYFVISAHREENINDEVNFNIKSMFVLEALGKIVNNLLGLIDKFNFIE